MNAVSDFSSAVSYAEARLPNGLRTIVLTTPHLHTAALALCIRCGSRHEEKATNGVSHFLEHMVFRGCAAFPDAYQLNLAIERLGLPMEATTFRDGTLYEMQCNPGNVAQALELLGEVVAHPTYPGIEIERNVLIEEALEDLDDDGAVIELDDVAKSARWWNHPLGQSICGSVENLRRISIDDLESHRARHYCGANMTLVVGGPIDAAGVFEAASRSLGRLPQGVRAVEEPPSCIPKTQFKVAQCEGPQAEVQLSFAAFAPSDPDFPALTLMEDLLSQGMTSLLQRRICDALGLAYDVGAGCETYSDVGLFHFEGTVSHERVDQLCEEFVLIANELKRQPLARDEFEHTLERYCWRHLALVDAVAALCHWTAIESLYHDGPVDLPGHLERVMAVRPAELQGLAQRLFTEERMLVAVVGPLSRRRKRRIGGRLGELLSA